MYEFSSNFKKMEKEGFRDGDWMELPHEEGLDVISLPQVTNIPSALAALTISLDRDELAVLEASYIDQPVEA